MCQASSFRQGDEATQLRNSGRTYVTKSLTKILTFRDKNIDDNVCSLVTFANHVIHIQRQRQIASYSNR